jgi:hypothetical protein
MLMTATRSVEAAELDDEACVIEELPDVDRSGSEKKNRIGKHQ